MTPAQLLHGLAARLAPIGTRRRRLVRWLQAWPLRLRAGPATSCRPDLFNVSFWHERLGDGLLPILPSGQWPEPTDDTTAARLILSLLVRRPDLARRHRDALTAGPEGAFARRFLAVGRRQGWGSEALSAVRRVFAEPPGERVSLLWDTRPDLRAAYPLARTAPGLATWLAWLCGPGRRLGLTPEEIAWFSLGVALDRDGGLEATYRRLPHWQWTFPDGLTASGRPALIAWLRHRYRLPLAWTTSPSEIVPPSRPSGANVLGHFAYPSGLSEAAAHTAAALEAVGLAVSRRDVPTGYASDRPWPPRPLGLEDQPVSLIHVAPEPLLADAYHLAGLWRRPGVYRVGVWYWELETVPPTWARHGRWLNEIWAPTRFIAEALRGVMPIPVTPMLPGVATPRPAHLGRSHFGLPEDRTLFVFVFDMCSVFERKNPLAVIEAFRRAFAHDNRAALAIKVSRGRANAIGLRQLQSAAAEVGATLIDRLMPRDEAAALIACADAYVSLHRSEGFGLTLAEAMLLGKPVIATDYSGNLDFTTPANSLLVEAGRVPLQQTYGNYPRGAFWAEPSIEHAAAQMRWVVEHPEAARALGEVAQRDAEERLSLKAYGQRLAARLAAIDRERRAEGEAPR